MYRPASQTNPDCVCVYGGFLQISSSAESEAKTSTGLVKGHAYSVTGLEEVSPLVTSKLNYLKSSE